MPAKSISIATLVALNATRRNFMIMVEVELRAQWVTLICTWFGGTFSGRGTLVRERTESGSRGGYEPRRAFSRMQLVMLEGLAMEVREE